MERLAAFCEVEWDVTLEADLPLSRHTLDSPNPDKWRRNAPELDPYFERVREVAARAHGVFPSPPRIKPVARRAAPPAPAPAPARDRVADSSAAADAQTFDSVHTAAFPELLAELGSSILVRRTRAAASSLCAPTATG